ncbi:MAG: DUF4178 domain-containing protein [Chlorobaculum sp.]|jgi:hypothetical protein|nr:DUF4178 domain-containing protein [Chlorobaculum sp.]
MKKVNCPSCGAEVTFQSGISVYAVCAYCRSMIVRHDVDVESIGTMASLPEDMSPLQIGTEGHCQGQFFRIIGRLKVGWVDGAWNEWFLYMDDGLEGWLAEAQGSYAISLEIDHRSNPETEQALNRLVAALEKQETNGFLDATSGPLLGSYITLGTQQLKVVDIKRAVCLGSEGELPFAAPRGRQTISIDLSGSGGEFGCIELLDGKPRVYLGNYVEWDEMGCKNLRALEGW